ncbi:hypothetical protein LZ554_001465 [Drepanopeziza brunnea f. sp. 'monogermtubi']|nr:hypothetical protein LZ554_001465 [Drepanopeziza brunnea f. sp. 'monogermtubi']
MVFNTATVGGAVTPVVIQTFLNHYLNRKPLAQKPTAHVSYDEGLQLIRKFLLYASYHTVEDLQRFTAQWVPHPRWVKVDEVTISEEHVKKAAEHIQEQLGHHGIEKVGGKTWWQWRRPGSEVKAEWIEMRSDYNERKVKKDPGKRVMLYVHGGAYFFGSVDEHRYQMQRHARKLKARVFAREFCDTLGSELSNVYSTVSTGTSIPISLRSARLLGCVFVPSYGPGPNDDYISGRFCWWRNGLDVAGDNPLDYIPPHGFHQKPSPSWPPPNPDDLVAIEEEIVKNLAKKDHASHPQKSEADAVQGSRVDHNPPAGLHNDDAVRDSSNAPTANTVPGQGRNLSIIIDGKLVEIKDQIQMYASNQLISHPLVSPVLQPSLGGLPPLLILTGGGEMLRDEQIYIAHKAANPIEYAPGDVFLDESPHDHNRNQVNRWKPTDVQLQVWDDLCHVAPTLSFTRPAKYMYRSIAQFGAWALARAQESEINILDDDSVSVISQSSDSGEEDEAVKRKQATQVDTRQVAGQVGKAGDPLPPFNKHMIRQRVDRHGNIFNLELASELPACNVPASEVGIIKEGPVKKWMAAKREWDTKFASAKRKIQKQRAKEMAKGYANFGHGEVPPPSALAGRRKAGDDFKEEKKSRSMGMSLWALWGSKHDEKTMALEKEADKEPETTVASAVDGAGARPLHDTKTNQGKEMDRGLKPGHNRSRSRRNNVADEHQTGDNDVDENTTAFNLLTIRNQQADTPRDEYLTPTLATDNSNYPYGTPAIVGNQQSVEEYDLKRPKANGIAFPFTLRGHQSTASMTTLTSVVGVPPASDVRNSGTFTSGVSQNKTDIDALNSTGNSSEEAKASREVEQPTSIMASSNGGALTAREIEGKGKEKVVENGEVVSAERPPMETFFTAPDVTAVLKKAQM